MITGVEIFFYHEGDNVLRDQMGLIISKEVFFNMFEAVYETYEDVDESEIDTVNEKILKELRDEMKRVPEPSEPKPMNTKGYVYFVRADGNFTKVGSTVNIKSRYKSLKTTSPHDLKMEMYIESNDCRKLEKSIHELLTELDCNVSGEWFDIKEKELKEIHKLLAEKDLEIKMYEGDIKWVVATRDIIG